MQLPVLPQDKANHWAYGAAIACAVALLLGPVPAAIACVAAAIGKELIDHRGQGTPDVLDALATIAGGACVLLPLFVGAY